LNPLAVDVPHGAVVIGGARTTNIHQQFNDGVLRNASHADSGTDRASFDKGVNDLDAAAHW
jgi:hypothetical protein